jgi:hypothetical protein
LPISDKWQAKRQYLVIWQKTIVLIMADIFVILMFGCFRVASANMHIENVGDKKYFLCFTGFHVLAAQSAALCQDCAGDVFQLVSPG